MAEDTLIEAVRERALPLRGDRGPRPAARAHRRRARTCCWARRRTAPPSSTPGAPRSSRRLIDEKGFSFIAVEGDWPDCYRVNRYVKGRPTRATAPARCCTPSSAGRPGCGRTRRSSSWPSGCASTTTAGPDDAKVGLLRAGRVQPVGFDVRGHRLPRTASTRRSRRGRGAAFRCFEPYGEDVQEYARATRARARLVRGRGRRRCWRAAPQGAGVSRATAARRSSTPSRTRWSRGTPRRYYRAMVRGGPESWNVRDRHMAETLERLMRAPRAEREGDRLGAQHAHRRRPLHRHGARRAWSTSASSSRERHGDEGVVLVGFGSYRGQRDRRAASGTRRWSGCRCPPAREGSWEDVLHQAGAEDKLLLPATGSTRCPACCEPRGHRAIGVVYHPEYERYGNYVPTVLPRRYDAFLYIDETEALHPLHLPPRGRARGAGDVSERDVSTANRCAGA